MGLATNNASFLGGMRENLFKGIEYYQTLSSQLVEDCRDAFLEELQNMQTALEPLVIDEAT